MENLIKKEVLEKLKDLKVLSGELSYQLEDEGLSITHMAKEQLFSHNLKSIIISVESLLRNEPSERAILRLKKDIPETYSNINKVLETDQGKKRRQKLEKIKEIIQYVEKNYEVI